MALSPPGCKTWRFTGTYHPNYKSTCSLLSPNSKCTYNLLSPNYKYTYNLLDPNSKSTCSLLRGLRDLISAVLLGYKYPKPPRRGCLRRDLGFGLRKLTRQGNCLYPILFSDLTYFLRHGFLRKLGKHMEALTRLTRIPKLKRVFEDPGAASVSTDDDHASLGRDPESLPAVPKPLVPRTAILPSLAAWHPIPQECARNVPSSSRSLMRVHAAARLPPSAVQTLRRN